MLEILLAVVLFVVPDSSVRGLVSTAPTYLDSESARKHIGAAVVAATLTGTDVPTLLSIGWHETRYVHTERTIEPSIRRGEVRFSCGVMTPEPITDHAACDLARSSIVEGYIAGARHLRRWLDLCRGHRWCALRGYAGAATHDCTATEPTKACIAARDFVQRAAWIRSALGVDARRGKRPSS